MKKHTWLLGYIPGPTALRDLARQWGEMLIASLADAQCRLVSAATREMQRASESESKGGGAQEAALRGRYLDPSVAESERSKMGRARWRTSCGIQDWNTAVWELNQGQKASE